MTALGRPRLHLRSTSSTNDRARELAIAGAPHGTLVTASEQTTGRGRQGRRWEAPAGSALLMSVILRSEPMPRSGPAGAVPQIPDPGGEPQPPARPPAPLPLLAAVAVCDVAGPEARVKWPNDIVLPRAEGAAAKLAGILTEARPQESWAVLGIGLNVAVRLENLPPALRETAATLAASTDAIEPTLTQLLVTLERRLNDPPEVTLNAWRGLDALCGQEITWEESHEHRHGRAEGIDPSGRLLVALPDGGRVALEAGEVHLRNVD